MNGHRFGARAFRLFALAGALGLAGPGRAPAAVGDQVHMILAPFFSGICSVGVAADGTSLFYSRCTDRNIYRIDPISGALLDTFDTKIPELPNALAFDSTRNGLWIGVQGGTATVPFTCGVVGVPIYFWDFDDDSVTKAFTMPVNLVNPANDDFFFKVCFIDGIAFNANNLADPADDELWISDDAHNSIMVFRPNGTLIRGYEASTVHPSLSSNSGLAIGGPNLYMGNNGGGDVFRADIASDPLAQVDQFTSGDTRQEDLECDPITFAPTEVMWVRTTTQLGQFPDAFTAYEIEPDTCGIGGQDPACGDGHLDPGEECDDGNDVAGDGCSPFCRLESCGNGVQDPSEQCDDGNQEPGDGCSPSCLLERCGNGILDPGEQCDDGNTTGGDGCSASCTRELCGNGELDMGEGCDDGNTLPGDGCSPECRVERCGNGVLDPGEQCDDGNLADGDGCSANCTRESDLCGCLDLDEDGWVTSYGPCPGDKHNRWLPDCMSFNDCDDADPTIHPLAEEIPGDGIDQNCNGIMKCGAAPDAGTWTWTLLLFATPALVAAVRRLRGG